MNSLSTSATASPIQRDVLSPRLWWVSIFALCLAILLASCGAKEEEEVATLDEPEIFEEEVVEEEEPEPEPIVVERLAPGECIPNCNIPFDAINDPSGNLADKTVNFEFDQSTLNEEDRDTLRYQAEYLTSWPDTVITIEGHCDERGSPEYNVALGYRRANAVQSFLISLGVSASQLNTYSAGEDAPVIAESNEFAWAQNRRGVLAYK